MGWWSLTKDKVRIYVLARELNLESKDLIDMCQEAGLDVKNQLSSIDADQRDLIEQMLKQKRSGAGATPATPRPVPSVARPTQLLKPIPVLHTPKPLAPSSPVLTPATTPIPASKVERPAVKEVAPPAPPAAAADASTSISPAATPPPATIPPRLPPDMTSKIRNLDAIRRPSSTTGPVIDKGKPGAEKKADKPDRPKAGAPRILPPPQRKKLAIPIPGKTEEKKPDQPATQKPLMKLSPEMLQGGGLNVKDVLKKIEEKVRSEQDGGRGMKIPAVAPGAAEDEEEDEEKRRPGAVKGREERHKKRNLRAKTRPDDVVDLRRIELDEEETSHQRQQRLHRLRHQQRPSAQAKKSTKILVEPPFTIRSLSEAMGVPAQNILRKLLERKMMVNINAVLEESLAEEIAIELGHELEIKKPMDPEEMLLKRFEMTSEPERLVPRAPIVTIMGHVDHGKTSLLDRIRESNVVATEAGGITQHLRAWRVLHGGRPITFLDTPGHEAFTQMRARGANVTDIVVLVVAADDGVMPQTDEAISHAKAAGVPIIVCINKADLPNANIQKARQQLYGRELIPDDMGGDTPFLETVATKDRARGINELLDMISLVAELKELKANPHQPASGVCLEACVSGDEGVSTTVLVQNGTLHKGDVILCGPAYGRVRAMFNDLGMAIEEAGPSVPVRIMGLDEPPNADDKFYVLPDLSQARDIAERRRDRQRQIQPMQKSTFRLEDLGKVKAFELKLIIKADVRGSIEAITKEIGKLTHEEVRLKVLHAGVGAITEGDVVLALASPDDTLIVGFNVVPDDRAKSLADEKGVNIRQYNIIYQLTDDLRAALEGRLKPHEEIINLGRAVVRDTFKISRVGTIAGCYVTQGTIERSARIRLIRDGVIIYPPADRAATLDSLKRFKDDVREVREGFECGLKIAGYDDVKKGDVIEAYKIEQVQRTL